jgi:tyrosyl-tRNA synthetase
MLTMESVKTRLEVGLSFLEFNYMILQAYDFMILNKRHGCRLQMGGSDQWGNICAGIDLTRRMNHEEVYGLTFPLVGTSSGAKMGKTAAGAVWLAAQRTSPFDFFQYWINVEDLDVGRFLRLFTLLPLAEIEKLEALQGADIREAKRALAFEVTKLVHGEKEAVAAEKGAAALFGGGGQEGSIPSSQRPNGDLEGDGLWIVEALVTAQLCPSNGAARRLIRQNGVRIHGEIVTDEMFRLTPADVRDGRIALQVGKKKHHHILIG